MNKEQAQTAEILQEIKIRAKVALDYAWNCDRTNSGCQVPQVLRVVQKDVPYLLALIESLQRERDERDNPQPLTMDELRAMNGKPVYIVLIDKTNIADPADAFNGWGMVRWSWVRMWDATRGDLIHVDHDFCNYGESWLAYATEPKGDATT